MERSTLRLGFYYHIPALQQGPNVRMPGFFGRFVDSLAGYCAHLTCFLPEATAQASRRLCDYALLSANFTWINLGPPRSALSHSFFSRPLLRTLSAHLDGLDALLIRGPSPLLPGLARAAAGVPVVLLLVGDYEESSAVSTERAWRKLPIRAWAKWYSNQQTRIARDCLTFVNSRRLYRQLERFVTELRETHTTTLESADFFERGDTCLQRPVRLLYTGRYSASKGLFDLVEALALLTAQGEDAVLDLVGWPDSREEDIVDRLMRRAQEKGVGERVVDHGYRAVGPDLFGFYRRADIYLLASLSSFEGFPRTIWEAMANSLPVVATRVGSIPDYVGTAAELVEPGNVGGMVAAVSHIIHDADRREYLICEGRKLAVQNTLEIRTREMMQTIYQHLESMDGTHDKPRP